MSKIYSRLIFSGWPDALIKATEDQFGYMARLRTGEVVAFEGATYISDEWVRLENHHYVFKVSSETHLPKSPNFDRGIEVRVDNIMWVADGPYGS
jgi:hypothetical protein